MKKYFLNYYVGGFVDTYITEEIELADKEKALIHFVAKTYSHITGEAININAFDKKNHNKVKEIILNYRLAYIVEVEL